MNKLAKILALAIAATMLFGICATASAADYPTKGISVICPWGAGGGTDACLRAVCQAAEKTLGQTLTVENKTGGGGIVGHSSIMTAKPDGYTIGMITFELSTYTELGTELSYADFEPICRINTDAAALTVNAEWAKANGITDVATFVDYCKANPGTVNIGGSAPASVWHIGAGLLAEAAGIDIKLVTYQEGAATAVTNAAGGHIQGVSVSVAEARSQIEAGNLICLGVMDTDPAKISVQNVETVIPTFKEQGYDIEYGTWRGIGVPKGTPDDVKATLAAAFEAAVQDADFVAFMDNAGQKISYLNAEDFTAFLERNLKDVSETMIALGLNEEA